MSYTKHSPMDSPYRVVFRRFSPKSSHSTPATAEKMQQEDSTDRSTEMASLLLQDRRGYRSSYRSRYPSDETNFCSTESTSTRATSVRCSPDLGKFSPALSNTGFGEALEIQEEPETNQVIHSRTAGELLGSVSEWEKLQAVACQQGIESVWGDIDFEMVNTDEISADDSYHLPSALSLYVPQGATQALLNYASKLRSRLDLTVFVLVGRISPSASFSPIAVGSDSLSSSSATPKPSIPVASTSKPASGSGVDIAGQSSIAEEKELSANDPPTHVSVLKIYVSSGGQGQSKIVVTPKQSTLRSKDLIIETRYHISGDVSLHPTRTYSSIVFNEDTTSALNSTYSWTRVDEQSALTEGESQSDAFALNVGGNQRTGATASGTWTHSAGKDEKKAHPTNKFYNIEPIMPTARTREESLRINHAAQSTAKHGSNDIIYTVATVDSTLGFWEKELDSDCLITSHTHAHLGSRAMDPSNSSIIICHSLYVSSLKSLLPSEVTAKFNIRENASTSYLSNVKSHKRGGLIDTMYGACHLPTKPSTGQTGLIDKLCERLGLKSKKTVKPRVVDDCGTLAFSNGRRIDSLQPMEGLRLRKALCLDDGFEGFMAGQYQSATQPMITIDGSWVLKEEGADFLVRRVERLSVV